MVSTESILEEYSRADFDKRLNLFLECPSLRTWFIEMDQRKMAGEHSCAAIPSVRCNMLRILGLVY